MHREFVRACHWVSQWGSVTRRVACLRMCQSVCSGQCLSRDEIVSLILNLCLCQSQAVLVSHKGPSSPQGIIVYTKGQPSLQGTIVSTRDHRLQKGPLSPQGPSSPQGTIVSARNHRLCKGPSYPQRPSSSQGPIISARDHRLHKGLSSLQGTTVSTRDHRLCKRPLSLQGTIGDHWPCGLEIRIQPTLAFVHVVRVD